MSSTRVLVLFRGLPGVGKSTLAKAVSRELRGSTPLVDKDDHRDALAEVFDRSEESEQINADADDEELRRRQNLFREKLNEASYAAAFNATRTLFVCSRCPCVLLDSPLSRASTAERALALAEELANSGDDNIQLRFVVVAVGASDEQLWRSRLETRARALEESGSHSAKHKPRTWETVVALRERGRRAEGERLKEDEEEGETTTFRDQMLRDLGIVDASEEPFARLWQESAARFVIDTAREGKGDEGRAKMTAEAAAKVAEAVRAALGDHNSSSSDVIFID